MIKLVVTDSYLRRAKKFFKKHPNLIKQYEKTLKLLVSNPSHPSLRLHAIESKNLHSISINMSYRVLLSLRIKEDGTIILIDIGNHDDVYG
ncbi:plasmid stabilization protein [Vibrio mediterranei]|uniref:Plasmid stabilization protein n=1 Tax=Vibrio mediterranei TaxID=689 RepID=A0ABX5D4L3_9VIBR|nr:plasmid stabilization protein [Vibrio mediterranei]PRQ64519.1 plasmid stabilization protein [Vibrio mediterranei]